MSFHCQTSFGKPKKRRKAVVPVLCLHTFAPSRYSRVPLMHPLVSTVLGPAAVCRVFLKESFPGMWDALLLAFAFSTEQQQAMCASLGQPRGSHFLCLSSRQCFPKEAPVAAKPRSQGVHRTAQEMPLSCSFGMSWWQQSQGGCGCAINLVVLFPECCFGQYWSSVS